MLEVTGQLQRHTPFNAPIPWRRAAGRSRASSPCLMAVRVCMFMACWTGCGRWSEPHGPPPRHAARRGPRGVGAEQDQQGRHLQVRGLPGGWPSTFQKSDFRYLLHSSSISRSVGPGAWRGREKISRRRFVPSNEAIATRLTCRGSIDLSGDRYVVVSSWVGTRPTSHSCFFFILCIVWVCCRWAPSRPTARRRSATCWPTPWYVQAIISKY